MWRTVLSKYFTGYRGLSLSIWQNISVSLIESILVGISYFLVLYFVTILHMNMIDAGLIMSCNGIGTILGGYFGGKLSDKINPRYISIVSLILQAISYFMLTQTSSMYMLMLILFVLGMGSYGFIISNQTYILSKCQQDQRLKVINIMDATSNLGLGISGIIIGFISIKYFGSVFAFSSVALFATSIILYLNAAPVKIVSTETESSDFRKKKSDKILSFYILSFIFIAGLIVSQTSSTYPVFLQSIFPSMETKSVGFLFSINTFMVVLLQAPLVYSVKNINKPFLAGLGVCLLGVGMVILNYAFIFSIAIIACVIYTIGEIIFFSVSQLICYENSSENRKGEALGLFRTFYATSRMTGPALGGYIYQNYNGSVLWNACFLSGLLCLMISIFVLSPKEKCLTNADAATEKF